MRQAAFFAFCLILLSLSGCIGAFDPYQRPGDWAERGAMNETIAQQAANPADLISGQSSPTTNGVAASSAIDLALGANGAGTGTGLHTAISATYSSSGSGGGSGGGS